MFDDLRGSYKLAVLKALGPDAAEHATWTKSAVHGNQRAHAFCRRAIRETVAVCHKPTVADYYFSKKLILFSLILCGPINTTRDTKVCSTK